MGKKSEPQRTVIIMLGAPGAGKGTQAAVVSKTFDLPHISTGDLFRENMKGHTEIGQKAKSYMDSGQLVPDTIVLDMLYERIKREDCARGFILDGCPRTVAQAEAIDQNLADCKILALNLDVPDGEIVRRIADRMVCESCGTIYDSKANPPKEVGLCNKDGAALIRRKDDNPHVVQERLVVYHKETAPVKGFYEKTKRLIEVDGTQKKEAISASIQETLNGVI